MAKLCLPETRCCIHGSTDLHFKRKVIPCPKPSEDSTLHTSSFSLFLFSGCMMIVEKWPKTYASCFGYPQCLGLSRSYDQWPMHFCKALFWKIALDKSVCQMPKCKCKCKMTKSWDWQISQVAVWLVNIDKTQQAVLLTRDWCLQDSSPLGGLHERDSWLLSLCALTQATGVMGTRFCRDSL